MTCISPTNEEFDKKLFDINPNLKRIGNYLNSSIKIKFQCNFNHIWETTPKYALCGAKCPTCNMRKIYTNELFDKEIENRPILRMSNYVALTKPITMKCKIHTHIWTASAGRIIKGGGCPMCAREKDKLSNDEFDLRIQGRNIIRLDDYINSQTKIKFQCNLDDNIWLAYPNNILRGKGCPICGRQKQSIHSKLTNDEFDTKLLSVNENIKRLEDYKTAKIKITFQCNDNHTWQAVPNSILNGSGCPVCYKTNGRSTNEEFDEKLLNVNKNIKRIGNYITSISRIEFRGNNGHIWKTTPDRILQGSGCGKCFGNVILTSEEFDEKLLNVNKNIKRIGNYITSHTKIEFQCDKGHIWLVMPSHILSGRGCPNCANHIKLTNDVVDERLHGRTIERIGNYVNSNTLLKFQCLKDNHTWEAIPYHVLSGSGCPKCATGKSERHVGELIQQHLKVDNFFPKKRIHISKNKFFIPDFRLKINNKDVYIEYNGQQHYFPVIWNHRKNLKSKELAAINFKKQKRRDEIVRKYCKNNNIFLLEIPYTWKESKIIEELLKLNTI